MGVWGAAARPQPARHRRPVLRGLRLRRRRPRPSRPVGGGRCAGGEVLRRAAAAHRRPRPGPDDASGSSSAPAEPRTTRGAGPPRRPSGPRIFADPRPATSGRRCSRGPTPVSSRCCCPPRRRPTPPPSPAGRPPPPTTARPGARRPGCRHAAAGGRPRGARPRRRPDAVLRELGRTDAEIAALGPPAWSRPVRRGVAAPCGTASSACGSRRGTSTRSRPGSRGCWSGLASGGPTSCCYRRPRPPRRVARGRARRPGLRVAGTSATAGGTASPSLRRSGSPTSPAAWPASRVRGRHRTACDRRHLRRGAAVVALRPERPDRRQPALRLQAGFPHRGRAPGRRPSAAALGAGTPVRRCSATGTSPRTTPTCGTSPRSTATPTSRRRNARRSTRVRHAGADDELVDLFPRASADPGDARPPYTFWEMRMLGFQKGRGMRIDLALANATFAAARHRRLGRPRRPQGSGTVGPRPARRRRRPRLRAAEGG